MSGQFEKSHNSNNGEELQYVGIFNMGGVLLQDQIDVKTHRGDIVYDVYGGFDEFAFIRGRDEPDEDLEREPRVANAFYVKECNVGVCLHFVQSPTLRLVSRRHCIIPYHRHSHVRMGFQAERYDGHANEEH